MVGIGGRLLQNDPIEALFPILLVPLIVGIGWLLMRAGLAVLLVAGGEIGRLAGRVWRRDSGDASGGDG